MGTSEVHHKIVTTTLPAKTFSFIICVHLCIKILITTTIVSVAKTFFKKYIISKFSLLLIWQFLTHFFIYKKSSLQGLTLSFPCSHLPLLPHHQSPTHSASPSSFFWLPRTLLTRPLLRAFGLAIFSAWNYPPFYFLQVKCHLLIKAFLVFPTKYSKPHPHFLCPLPICPAFVSLGLIADIPSILSIYFIFHLFPPPPARM